jgi:hypothetical protein
MEFADTHPETRSSLAHWISKVLANTAKHLAFTRCGELNLFGMVEAQVATVEHELLANVV